MNNNQYLNQFLIGLFVLLLSPFSMAKVINSEFLNQAGYGSEGPQIHELEVSGTRTYLLTYNVTGKRPLFRALSKEEYQKLQGEMREILESNADREGVAEPCDKEITYTRVEEESNIKNTSLCWERLGSEKRVRISDWFIGVRRTLR